MKKESVFLGKTFQMLLFCTACVLQIFWLIGIFNYGDLLIGTSFSMDCFRSTIGSSAFFIELGLFCVSNILMLIVARYLRKWELVVLIILVLIESGIICLFAVFWFSRVWVRHPPTCFGLGHFIVLGLILSIQIIIHVGMIIRCQGDGSLDNPVWRQRMGRQADKL